MANFDDLVQRTAEAAGVVAGKSAMIVKKAVGSAKEMVQVGKLNVDIAAERDGLRRNYTQLGKLYYQAHKDDPAPEVEQIVAEITRAEEKIAEMQSEIELVKASGCDEVSEPEQESDANDDFEDFEDVESDKEDVESDKNE